MAFGEDATEGRHNFFSARTSVFGPADRLVPIVEASASRVHIGRVSPCVVVRNPEVAGRVQLRILPGVPDPKDGGYSWDDMASKSNLTARADLERCVRSSLIGVETEKRVLSLIQRIEAVSHVPAGRRIAREVDFDHLLDGIPAQRGDILMLFGVGGDNDKLETFLRTLPGTGARIRPPLASSTFRRNDRFRRIDDFDFGEIRAGNPSAALGKLDEMVHQRKLDEVAAQEFEAHIRRLADAITRLPEMKFRTIP